MDEWLDVDKITELAERYKALGPFIGLLLPFIESFLPFLPLFAFVIANTVAYGIWYGFILSWAGTVVGSYAVFLIIRKYGRNRFLRFLTKHERVQRLIGWVERITTRSSSPLGSIVVECVVTPAPDHVFVSIPGERSPA